MRGQKYWWLQRVLNGGTSYKQQCSCNQCNCSMMSCARSWLALHVCQAIEYLLLSFGLQCHTCWSILNHWNFAKWAFFGSSWYHWHTLRHIISTRCEAMASMASLSYKCYCDSMQGMSKHMMRCIPYLHDHQPCCSLETSKQWQGYIKNKGCDTPPNDHNAQKWCLAQWHKSKVSDLGETVRYATFLSEFGA